jgi:hypothetical protein
MHAHDTQRRWLSVLVLLAACSNTVAREGSAADESHCMPGAARVCPCFGGGMGSQFCDESGTRYAECIGCPDGAAGARSTTSTTSDQPGIAPGVACGVAFPVLCAPQRETCCVRSLSVDSCIPSDSGCGCGMLDCVATAVRCDGPEDCPSGQSCCGQPALDADDADGYASFACADRCAVSQHQACHAGQTTCPSGLVCTNSQYLTNMQVCVDPASLAQ